MSLQEYAQNIKEKSKQYSDVLIASKYLLKHSSVAKDSYEYLKTRISAYNIDKFNFGYFPKTSELKHLYKEIDRDALIGLRLVSQWNDNNSRHLGTRDISFFNHHNIIFPSHGEYGNIVGLVGRTDLPDQERESLNISKYKYTNFSRSLHLFGLDKSRRSIEKKNYAIIVEGQIDCISCHGHGYHNVVALGSANLGDYQVFLLKKYTDTIYLLLDNDSAGEKATDKIVKKYSEDINIKRLKLPRQYKDVDEYLKNASDYRIFERLK